MSDSTTKLLTCEQAARRIPISPRPSPNSIWRWTTRGCLAKSGVRVKLRSLRFGRRLRIEETALAEFAAELARENSKGIDRPAKAAA
jgi:hypothetical protein